VTAGNECKNFVNGQLKGSCRYARKFEQDPAMDDADTGGNQSGYRMRCKTCPADQAETGGGWR
jgi:hypothetical protein